MVSVYVPTGVLADVETVSVEEPDPVIEVGTNEAAAPEGKPLAEKLTEPEKPFSALTDTAYATLPPRAVDRDDGEAASEKSGAGLTVIVRVGGLGSVTLALSVTVNVAVNVPAEE
jgi:hypothetical protein